MRRGHTLAAIGFALALSVGTVAASHAAPSSAKTVTIKGTEKNDHYVFAPVTKTIKVGTRVRWTDPSDAPHTVTSDTSSWSYNKQLAVGKSLSFTFNKAGTYRYHCAYHPGMVGKIVVTR